MSLKGQLHKIISQRVQSKINQVDWDIKKMELEGRNASSYSLYMSYVRLKSQYEMQLFKLQQELRNAL